MTSTPVDDWARWCKDRDAAVSAVPGNLALVSYQRVERTPTPIEQVPSATVALSVGGGGVLLHAESDAGVEVDGRLVSGDISVARLRPDGTPLIQAGRYWFDVFSLDGSDFELRVYDEQADNLARFAGIEVYDYDDAMVVPGRFCAFDATEKVSWEFTRAADSGHTKQVPGTITVDLAGSQRELLAFLDGSELVLVFADTTTGESYAPGRFLRIPRPDADDDLVVDFNRAFIPPCGFSDFYSCPIPPAQNRLDVAVQAGEKRVLWSAPRT